MQHRHVLDMVSTFFGIDYKIVEEGVVDEDLHIQLIESLTEEGGRRAVIFMYQEMPPPPIGKLGIEKKNSGLRVF